MNEIKEKIKPFLSEYVQEITKKSGGKNQYVCPFCHSGTGKNHSGAFTVYPESNTFFCFACQKSGDIFSLYGEMNNISDFKDVLNELSSRYGFVTDGKDYTKFFAFAESQLYLTDYLTKRGISPEIQRKFRCGYVPEYKYQDGKSTPAVIIPTSETSSYMWRSTSENIKQKRGTARILNDVALKDRYCFVVEGEIDCMSVVECGFSCIGLGSTSNIRKIFNNDTSKTVLIIAMDNDGAGQKATAELEKLCITHRTAFITANSDVWCGCKDANEALVSDRKRLTESLKSLVARAENFDRAEYLKSISGAGEAENWGTPESFESLKKLSPFPMQSLPTLLREYLKAVSDYVQVVPEMAIFPLLSVLSLCVQGKAVIKNTGNDYTEPLNLYTLTIAPPGERKSGCLKEFMRPVTEFQERYNKMHAPEIREYDLKRAFLENKKSTAMRVKDADFSAVNAIDKELAEVEEKLEKVHKIVLNISDTTPEALAMEMKKQGERMGIIDSEGTIFDVLSGIYSNGKANIDLILKSYAGEAIDVARCGKTINLKNPLLTVGLMTQPEHFTEAMNNKQFIGRGLMHRFLFSFPESKAGYLNMRSPDVPPELQKKYNNLIEKLLCIPAKNDAPIIVCDREAELLFSDYHDHLQKEMRDGGMFENLKEWAQKQFARALKIAGILHLCEHDAEIWLKGYTAMNAIAIAKWSENHALKAFSGDVSEPEEIRNAKYILKKLKKSGKIETSKSKLLLLCRPLHAPEINVSLEILEDMDYIRRVKILRDGERGNPKEIIKINPKFLEN